MNKIIFSFFLVLFLLDLFLRVLPTVDKHKGIDFEVVSFEPFKMIEPEKPKFNKHLFGEIKELEVSLKEPKKVVEVEPKLQLLAIYSTPEPYAFVRASNRNWPSKKLKIGELFAGYKFVEITQFGAVFEKAGKSQEFKVFKR